MNQSPAETAEPQQGLVGQKSMKLKTHIVSLDIAIQMTDTLQDMFVENRGNPIHLNGATIIQMDRVTLPEFAKVNIAFVGNHVFKDDAAVIAVPKPGRIFLPGSGSVRSVRIWDEEALPRTVEYTVKAPGKVLEVYNTYRIYHNPNFVTVDSFTGNAGMIVTELAPNKKRYECSNGLGEFTPNDLVFDLEWWPN